MRITEDCLRFGASWYPDHWPESQWDDDLAAMRDLGLECIRWGESSWTIFEPADGRFDWTFSDRVLEACAKAGMGVILGTPTYAAPSWLKEKHPDIITLRENGAPWYQHSRRMYDYTNGHYRDHCRRIVRAMAEHYGGHQSLWAWQLDNEMYCHLGKLYGESVRRAFHQWLTVRYFTIEELNRAWGMMFWSNQLDHFGQADLPGAVVTGINQHQLADYLRFLSDTAIDFLNEQAGIIKGIDSSALVLHNCPFDPVDKAKLIGGLDIYGHDHYPAFATWDGGRCSRPEFGLNYGRFRHYAKRLWCVEQEASQVGWVDCRMPTVPPGELATMALQSIAHGVDVLLWFNWRTCPFGQEITWGGLIPSWGSKGRHYSEAKTLINTLAPHKARIAATKARVTVARLVSFDQGILNQVESWIAKSIGNTEIGRQAIRQLGLNEDQLPAGCLKSSMPYTVALLPQAVALSAEDISSLEAWVKAGGQLIVGPLAGHRDVEFHAPTADTPPGPMGVLTGTTNGEATTSQIAFRGMGEDGTVFADLGLYAEFLEPREPGVEVCLRLSDGWYAGRPVVTQRKFGAGRVIHCGIPLSDVLLLWLWSYLNLPRPDCPIACASRDAEVLTREGLRDALHFVLNHGELPVVFEVKRKLSDLLSGETVTEKFELPSRSWRILRELGG